MRVEVNDKGEIWYYPTNPAYPPQLLEEADSLCGSTIFGLEFETGPDDPFRDCCSWHDNAYTKRAFFEERGWDRQRIDAQLLKEMLDIAGDDMTLVERAYRFNRIVRLVGWIFYYRHPGYTGPVKEGCEHENYTLVSQLIINTPDTLVA
jgi:hypothetical protein